MNIKAFAKEAGVSRNTIHDWINRGLLETKMWGKKPYLTSLDLTLVPHIKKLLKENQHRV